MHCLKDHKMFAKNYHNGQLYNLTDGLEDHCVNVFSLPTFSLSPCFTKLYSLYYLKWWCLINLSWETFASHLGTAVDLSQGFGLGITSLV